MSVTLTVFAKTSVVVENNKGKKLKIEVIALEKGELTFKAKNKQYKIALNTLTKDSIEKVRDAIKLKEEHSSERQERGASDKALSSFEKVNEAIGHPLFGTARSLWDEKCADIAKRLKWPLESRKENSSSYRLYTRKDYQFLGAHPYCVTLYGHKGDTPEQFSLVFANKGDFGSSLGVGEDHFRKVNPGVKPPVSLEEAIEVDLKLIAQSLTKALGAPKKQYYGEKEDKRKVQRWDCEDHSFLLSARDEEYVHLVIVRKKTADAKGTVKFVKDSDLKKMHLTNIKKEKNGDVWINNIPMVDQGPKGYCAPATFERAMRYMLVPADMYLLATAATTQSGTNTVKLADDCKRIVRSKARKIKELELNENFEMKKLKKYIDKGVPILWQMRSLREYNQIANKRSKERKAVTDWSKWAEEIETEAQQKIGSLNTRNNFHICMIIGYNEQTNEVAVSDSWGPNYEIRWVHISIAKAVTSRGGFVIDF